MDFTQRLEESRDIVDRAMVEFKPYATVLMLSGGDDSILTMNVLKALDIEPDYIMHGVTGTGIPDVKDFVRRISAVSGVKYLEADAKDAYERYVMRKGFFGKGVDAHTYSYHILKWTHFRREVSVNIRHRARNRNILFFNGVRVDESENRSDKLGENTYNIVPGSLSNIWVNVVHWWTTKERDEYLAGNNIERNPVSILLGRSGECMCGTMQSMATGQQAAELFPQWGKWWIDIRKRVTAKFPWDWSQNINKYHNQEMKGQGNMFNPNVYMPMCVGCKAKVKKNSYNI